MIRAFKSMAFGLTLLGIATYALADERALFGAVMVGLGLLGIWLTESRGGKPLPRPLILLCAGAALANAAWAATSNRLTVSEFSEFVTYLQVIKLFDRRRARDFAQLLSLATFQAIGAILTSNSLVVGLMLMVFVPGIVLGAGMQQIYAAAERAGSDPAGSATPAHGERARRHLAVVTAIATVCSLAGGLAAFMFVPRGIGAQRLGEWGNVSVGRETAFTDTVTLGVGGLISESQTEVMDVEVRDRAGNVIGSENRLFYLRGAVLDTYRDGQWTRTREDRETPINMSPGQPMPMGREPPRAATLTLRFNIRNASTRSGYLFTVWQPAQLTLVSTRASILMNNEDGTIRRESPPGKFEYVIRTITGPEAIFREREVVREREVISERVRELADEILEDADVPSDPAERDPAEDFRAAEALEAYLRENYPYTLDILAPPAGQDPIEFFLFSSRSGHCEYFASALAAMCRAVGIEARVVTGYLAAEFSEAVGRYIVRESNAHAWVEAQLGAGRWETLDATPPADLTRIHQPRMGPLARLRRAIDVVEMAWIDNVVSFDERRRAQVLGSEPLDQRRLERSIANVNMRVSAGGIGLVTRAIRNGLVTFGGVVLVGAGLATVWRVLRPRAAWWRRRRQVRADDPRLAALLKEASFFAELQDFLARKGHGRPAWMPALEHVARVREERPGAADASDLVRTYYKARFGLEPMTEEELREAKRTLEAFKRSMATGGRNG